jgi:hypothetical protein
MALNDIVNVTITRNTTVPSVQSFSDILIAGEFLASTITPVFATDERVRSYTSLTDMATAGFSTTGAVYLGAQSVLSQNPKVSKVYVGRKLTSTDGIETWTEALSAIAVDNNDWYGLVVGTRTLAEQELVADWVEANDKLCGLSSDDSNIISSTGDIAEYLQTNSLSRTFAFYHPNSDLSATDEFPEGAMLGKMFPKVPGSSSWKFKTLAGVSSYSLTSTERGVVLGKNCNIYTSVAGVAITEEGVTGDGSYIDVIRGTDALKATIQAEIYTALIQQDKVPFTDGGIKSIEGILKGVLAQFVGSNFLAGDPAPTTFAPLVSAVSTIDKGNRTLPDITFEAILAGAIHKVIIAGVLSL